MARRPDQPVTDLDLSVVDRLLTTTRSVRRRLDFDRAVDRSTIEECLDLALQAPTGSNLQRWRWVVVTDQATRDALGDIYRRAIDPYHDIMERLMQDDDRSRRVWRSSKYLADNLQRAPVHVIPCHLGTSKDMVNLLKPLGYPFEVTDNLAASGFYGSVWPAVWSLMLALRSRGLGAALTTMHLALEREAADVLGIPDTVSQVGLLPVAYFKGKTFRPAARRPAAEITYWDRWKNTRQAEPG